MATATVTSKGQVTIPKEIRDYLKLDAGSKVDFVVDLDGRQLTLSNKNQNAASNCGAM